MRPSPSTLAQSKERKGSNFAIWQHYNQVEEALQQGINLCEKWIDVCQKLTSLLWPNYSPHPWKGGPYAPDHAANVQRRLREVHSLRTMHKQLTQLLSHNEQDELKTAKSFEPFRSGHLKISDLSYRVTIQVVIKVSRTNKPPIAMKT